MNKRWLAIFLLLILLCGCSTPEAETVPSEPIAETKPTEPVGFYEPSHPLEQVTNGAVKAYPLDTSYASGIRFLGDDILLFSGYETTTLTLLAGENRYIKAEVTLSCPVSPADPSVVISDRGVTYVDASSRELVFLDGMLEETGRKALPADSGNVALSADFGQLYYCTADSLRVLDLETGLDRLIKEMTFPCQELTGLHCSDTVIQCTATYDDGNDYTLFFSTDTGELLYETPGDVPLWTWGDLYFATHMDGQYQELLSGSPHFGPSVLVTEIESFDMDPILERHSVLLHSQSDDGKSTQLDYYNLESGAHTARLILPGEYTPADILPDPSDSTLWFLCYDLLTERDILCAWDSERSGTEDSGNYLQPRWSTENPDMDGLARCETLAARISAKHDVQIRIWMDATESQPWDYTLVPEYQVPLIRQRLMELDEILSCYPPGFLQEAASQTGSGQLNICLVRGINGIADTGALESAVGLQFWDQAANAYLAVTPGYDMAQHIHHELFHIIDTRVLSSCSTYDNWHALNPPGFDYDFDYISNIHRSDWELVTGENRYFVDLYSMSYPKEDRARIMEYAMMSGQEDIFHSTPMQAKLRQLCLGIREAFHLEQSTQVYRWEQYLNEPILPKE